MNWTIKDSKQIIWLIGTISGLIIFLMGIQINSMLAYTNFEKTTSGLLLLILMQVLLRE